MSSAHDGPAHERFSGLAADLALGELTGRERAAMLAHLTECSSCRTQVQDMIRVVDDLLLLAPRDDPPLGFETRVARRLARSASNRRPVAVRTAVAAVAVAVAFAAGAVTVRVERRANSSAQGVPADGVALTGSLLVGGADHGDVVVTTGRPDWLFASVRDVGWTAEVTCNVTLAGGRSVTLGSFAVSSGYGSWSTALPVPASELRAVDLTDSGGALLGHAQLSR